MIGRAGPGWQTTLADMALILFMVASAAAGARRDTGAAETISAAALEAPVAVYRPSSGSTLASWMAEQGADPRLQLTIRASHRPGEREAAVRMALVLAAETGQSGTMPRIVIEQGDRTETIAFLAYDRNGEQVAHLLHNDP